MRLKATADIVSIFTKDYLAQERNALGEPRFNREYLGIPGGAHASLFGWDMYERATTIHTPLVPPGPAFAPPPAEPAVAVKNPFQHPKTTGVVR